MNAQGPRKPRGRNATGGGRRMLVIDSAYTHTMMVERNLLDLATSRDLDGYFDHVWACHPVASLFEEEAAERFGAPAIRNLAPRHTLIEGKIGRFRGLASFEKLNFALAQFGLFARLWLMVLRQRIDVVRAEDPLYNGLLAWLLARTTRRPLMIGVWGNPARIRADGGRPMMPRLFRTVAGEERVERFVLRRADAVMVQNEDNGRFVESVGVPRERIAIFRLGNALAPRHFEDPATRTGGVGLLAKIGHPGRPKLLVISRLEQIKLVEDAVEVARLLKDRGRKIDLLLAGDGPFRGELEALAERLEVDADVHFLGNRDQQWLFQVIPSIDVLISPLTGRALGEAALGAAPVVAYDVDWHGELIESGVTGELVACRDRAGMADAVERLLDDPDRAKALGKKLRDRALAMLSPESAKRDQVDTYERVIGGTGRGAPDVRARGQ